MIDDFSDFVGFAIDTLDVEPFTTFNDKFARDIGMNLLLSNDGHQSATHLSPSKHDDFQ